MYDRTSKMKAVDILRVVLRLNETEQQGTVETFDGEQVEMLPKHWFNGSITKGNLLCNSEYFYTYGTSIKGVEPDVEIVTEDTDVVLLYKID